MEEARGRRRGRWVGRAVGWGSDAGCAVDVGGVRRLMAVVGKVWILPGVRCTAVAERGGARAVWCATGLGLVGLLGASCLGVGFLVWCAGSVRLARGEAASCAVLCVVRGSRQRCARAGLVGWVARLRRCIAWVSRKMMACGLFGASG